MGGRGGGVDNVSKVVKLFLPILGKYWNFGPIQKLGHSCPKWANTKITSWMSKMEGGSRAHFWTMSKRKVFFLLLLMSSLIDPPGIFILTVLQCSI